MATMEPPWKRLKAAPKPAAPSQPAVAVRPRVNIKPVIDLIQETVEWPVQPVPEVVIEPCCRHYRDLTRSTEKVNLTLSRRGATEVVGEAVVESPAEPLKEDPDSKDPEAVSTILCTLRGYRDPRSITRTEDGSSGVVAVAEEFRGTYGHIRDRKASSTVILGDSNTEQQAAQTSSVSESDSSRDATVTPKGDGEERSVESPSPVRSPSQIPSPPWMRAAQAAAASMAWFGKGKGMPFMGPAAFARMAAMNRMRAAQAYQDPSSQQRDMLARESSEEIARQHSAIPNTQSAVPMDPRHAVPQGMVPGLQYQPPRPVAQTPECLVPSMPLPPYQGGGGQFQSGGGLPPPEPPRPPPTGIQQQPPMPPWPPRGVQYGQPPRGTGGMYR